MFQAKIPEEHPFVLSLFGCQYHGSSPSPTKAELITTFDKLLKGPAVYVETLEQDGAPGSSSRVWMSYWKSPTDYQQWWTSLEVSRFWASLPADTAGFWRETMHLSYRRSMFESNKPVPNGLAHVGTIAPLTEKTGYWGAYRDRLADATPQDKLRSPLKGCPPQRVQTDGSIRNGRVAVKDFPDNLCFVVEGQDYAAMAPAEREHWRENMDAPTRKFVSHVVNAGPEAGMVSARLCHAPQSGRVDGATVDADGQDWPLAFDFNRRVQLLFFLDLSYMELIGRRAKSHVQIMRGFKKSHSPGGEMEKHAFLLWVEVCVIKAQDVDAEYIGCYDGTGFMAYGDDFASQTQQSQLS